MNKAKIGIMSLEQYKQRTIAIAKGLYKPKKDEPKIWFTSMKSLANVLSEENQHLLKLIIENEPKSVSDLEALTGYKRKANNILRTLRTMEQYGLVKLEESPNRVRKGRAPLMPKALYDEFDVEFSLQQVC
ncbi:MULTISPECIES: transcriptional regulator [Legionella]|uniref:Transcriptional regulator n=1 Tax=Legionella quinlivanii TaxID=45073 RepID=A0A364LFS6_9GAMM|nr:MULTISPECIES: transcriptional regulator [Legionella]MCE3045465.1 transcriptional regulator [Legionella sp. 16cNR16C]RAP34931.1 transcriptional regulator [Legionella quinlivanii]